MHEIDYCPEGMTPAFETQVRPDGGVVTICEESNGDVVVMVDRITSAYNNKELLILGNGNRRHGILMVGHAAYNSENKPGSAREYHQYLKENT